MSRRTKGRAAALGPANREYLVVFTLERMPPDVDMTQVAGKRAVFRSVCRQLMDDHAKCLCCSNRQSKRRAVEFYPATDEILEVRELYLNEVRNFDALPPALHEQVVARSQGLHPFREACHELFGARNSCLPG